MKFLSIMAFIAGVCLAGSSLACSEPVSVCERDADSSFALVRAGRPAAVVIDAAADPAVRHAVRNFAADLQRVSGQLAPVLEDLATAPAEVVVVGVLGHSPLIDRLVADGKVKAPDLQGQWEAYRQAVVDQPWPGVARALVIAGADRRGAVFGAYDLSARIGVSPWHWWADVPVARRSDVFITAGERRDQPRVKYRGLFINDEDPALKTWAINRFGGVNAAMYAQVFELLLRLKGNYLWPAMWGKSFNVDDPRSMVLADEMGVVMGTSHHEPMMRAQSEWHRAKGGRWDYSANGAQLREFWRGGIARMAGKPGGGTYDSLVTIGMRGDGDEPMAEGTATALLEKIVAEQRQIIADVTRKPAAQTPQVWTLYKEVQDYYDQGMQVPDDVLLLFADDNWGNIRRLPSAADASRKGGFGVYYHFDYVGGPRNYKWLNTNQIEKVWQQMDLAYARGAKDLWVDNVGDIKPVEFPISFFLDMAWNPPAMSVPALQAYTARWAADTFGATLAQPVAALISTYSRYAARRKPELVDSDSFALGAVSASALDGGDFGARIAEWDALEAQVAAAKQQLRSEQHDAYFQLVEHPVLALANLYRLYYYTAWNRRLAAAGDARANAFADLAEAAFQRDQVITDRYHTLGGGKWNGMMLQTHIGYTSWQEPKQQVMPRVTRVTVPAGAAVDAAAVMAQLQAGSAMTIGSRSRLTLEATAFSRAATAKGLTWTAIPQLGHTRGAVTALPQGQAPTTVADNVRIDYEVQTPQRGDMQLQLVMVPTLDTRHAGGIRIGVAIDDRAPQTLKMDLLPATGPAKLQPEKDWVQAVKDSAFTLSARFKDLPAGSHTIKVWRLDDNAVLQRLVLEPAGDQPASSDVAVRH